MQVPDRRVRTLDPLRDDVGADQEKNDQEPHEQVMPVIEIQAISHRHHREADEEPDDAQEREDRSHLPVLAHSRQGQRRISLPGLADDKPEPRLVEEGKNDQGIIQAVAEPEPGEDLFVDQGHD